MAGDQKALSFVIINDNAQIISLAGELQIRGSNACAKDNLVLPLTVGYRVKTVAEVPSINIVAVSAVERIVSGTADKRVVTVAGVNRIIAAVTVYGVIITCAGNIIARSRLCQRQTGCRNIFNRTVCKFDAFNFVIAVREKLIYADTLIFITADNQSQSIAFAAEYYIIRCYSRTENNLIASARIADNIGTVAEVIIICIVVVTAVQSIIALAAGNIVIPVAGINNIVADAADKFIIVIITGQSQLRSFCQC